ncbi:MAG: GlxA family transcriptional regulator [Phyllobacterium sp.]
MRTDREPPRQGVEATIRFAVLVFPGFPLMAFSSVIEPLRAANSLAGRPCYSWITVGLEGNSVLASNGVRIETDQAVATAPVVDRVVVCSGGDADHVVAEQALVWIRKSLRSGAHIGAVADAAFFLARAGLLDGHACTLHWTSQAAFREAFQNLDIRRDLYVIDKKRFTSAGGIGSLDMMLELISADYGAALAAGIAEWYVHSPLRSNVDRRMMPLRLRTGIRDDLVLVAVAIMEDTVEERLTMAELARRLGVSPDKLERVFLQELKTAPGSYYRTLKLRHAADLLAHSKLRIGEIALACGFGNASSFSRAFREHFGHAPNRARNRAWGQAGQAYPARKRNSA